MMTKNSSLTFYHDTLLIEALLSDGFNKQAQSGLVSSLMDRVKEYVAGKIDPNDKIGSVANLLTPGILWALGFPVLSFIIKLAQMFFGLDVGKIFSSVAEEVKSLLHLGQPISSQQVDQITDTAIQANYGQEPTETDLATAPNRLQALTFREVQLYKIAITNAMAEISFQDLDQWETNILPIAKRAQIMTSLLKLIGLKHKTAGILGKVIGWIVKAILASGGFMVAGDLINHFLDRSDAPPTASGVPFTAPKTTTPVSMPTSTQSVFPINPNYTEEKLNLGRWWIEGVPPEQIGDQIVSWTEEIYPDLKDKENYIRSSSAFQRVVKAIQDYNATNTSNVTFMPKMFNSRKKVVDLFIDDLANRAQLLPPTKPSTKPETFPA